MILVVFCIFYSCYIWHHTGWDKGRHGHPYDGGELGQFLWFYERWVKAEPRTTRWAPFWILFNAFRLASFCLSKSWDHRLQFVCLSGDEIIISSVRNQDHRPVSLCQKLKSYAVICLLLRNWGFSLSFFQNMSIRNFRSNCSTSKMLLKMMKRIWKKKEKIYRWDIKYSQSCQKLIVFFMLLYSPSPCGFL